MKRADRIKINFIRNWDLPGKERLAHLLKPSAGFKTNFKDGIVWLRHEDIAIHTSADNYIEHMVLTTGTYEDEINKLIRVSLKPGFAALDIGANIGLQSIRMSQSCGADGKVYSFEPLQHIHQKFSRNIALNNCQNIQLFPFALSDSDGETTVNIDEQTWNQGAFSLNQESNGKSQQTITIKAGDTLSEIAALQRLDLIKIDVEGYEFQVLRGLKDTLRKHRPRIIFEYDDNYWQRTGQQMADCYPFLIETGYTLYQITQVGCELISNAADAIGGNIFCIPLTINNG
ncbi:FkbM family methyltransferase [Mucilaginibacter myungsuensis]|uniref:FkbM family methyltransferase n=1 Tax=Mucilaginibacter myungsuensis TaxID=649104 RepID=A0A929KXR0_9SPHI|nr:FkbM family methyltransferase [Mucilaginibacter myungsuensis]MBE9660839.1 FkbM family methyltransferase [Mucilaginibacter myungsuensis]MDN3600886.1 FkbM family methyltransferase [Mucilaginibacter myungsuensis]